MLSALFEVLILGGNNQKQEGMQFSFHLISIVQWVGELVQKFVSYDYFAGFFKRKIHSTKRSLELCDNCVPRKIL